MSPLFVSPISTLSAKLNFPSLNKVNKFYFKVVVKNVDPKKRSSEKDNSYKMENERDGEGNHAEVFFLFAIKQQFNET
jgi:hypothetical protein